MGAVASPRLRRPAEVLRGLAGWVRGERGAGLFAAAVGLLVLSVLLPYWTLHLSAPQYPQGLDVKVYLTHVGGDVAEVDELNHYIGMAPLAEAAPVERRLSLVGVGIAVLLLLLVRYTGRRVAWVLVIPVVLLPAIFAVDLFTWLVRYGHSLSPAAPIHLDPFTPPLLGSGIVGQFQVRAAFGPGWYLAVLAAALAVAGSAVRARGCRACQWASRCWAVCVEQRAGWHPGRS